MSRGADSQVETIGFSYSDSLVPASCLIGSQGSGLADLSIRYEYGQLGLVSRSRSARQFGCPVGRQAAFEGS